MIEESYKKYSNSKWVPIMTRTQIEKECDAIRQELYPDPNEYPFTGEYEGYPANAVIAFVKRMVEKRKDKL